MKFNAGFAIDVMSDHPQKLIPVTVNPTIEVDYGIDSDGFIQIHYAVIYLAGKETDLDTKCDKIKEWLKAGCEWHAQTK